MQSDELKIFGVMIAIVCALAIGFTVWANVWGPVCRDLPTTHQETRCVLSGKVLICYPVTIHDEECHDRNDK